MLTPELLDGLPDHNQLWLALSGGLDSVVLLDLAVQYCASRQKSLRVIHVHHGLSANADRWAEHCLNLCRCYRERLSVQGKFSVQESRSGQKSRSVSVDCLVERVQLNGTSSIEEQARKARYRVFENCLEDGDLLLMAHHGDDQLETLLLRLMRGAGAQGLSGMPIERPLGLGRLYRPLLSYPRAELEAYAEEKRLSWVEDESNQSLEFDRNFLRHEITLRLKSRWPHLIKVAGRSAQVLADADRLNNDLAEIDLERVMLPAGSLSRLALLELSAARQRNVLRFWLQSAGILPPDYRQIMTIIEELVMAQDDAQPLFRRPQYEIRRYRDQLILQLTDESAFKEWGAEKAEEIAPADQTSDSDAVSVSWSPDSLSDGGTFSLVKEGVGFQVEPVVKGQIAQKAGALYLPVSASLRLALREGGESLRLPRRGNKALKKLLQETGVPAWLRGQVRLFWLETEAGKSHLIGAWSPLMTADAVGSESESASDMGVFWWDIRVLEDDQGVATLPVIISRKQGQ
ncbi:tRNA lysidine(34) synthetase TilS [Oceanospirillum sanctuarii]|uniref:tRNA lysidine(34) synthetase TilS n=1 Tax=Oceanospirillum sanctuarii TaxID=1434821 RepID=UPI000A38816F|nr:tRNA lysidine(34) synthetase TilS [Oceanospirillum sanctuarii]